MLVSIAPSWRAISAATFTKEVALADNAALAALNGLRTFLGSQSTLRVLARGGHIWNAGFAFGPPASGDQIDTVERELGVRLPAVYRELLLSCDGGMLYEDMEYFQWGFRIFGTADLISGNSTVKGMHSPEWVPSFLACAECRGDSDFLVLDTAQPSADGRDCVVLDAFGGERPSQWDIAARSFGEWLDHLIVAQGQKYWLWRWEVEGLGSGMQRRG